MWCGSPPRLRRQWRNSNNIWGERFYPLSAARFVDRLVDACESLALAPHRGTARDDLRPGMRTIGFERKVTIYFKIDGCKVVTVNITYRGSTRGIRP